MSSSFENIAGSSAPSATRAAPVSVAKSTRSAGLSPDASAKRVRQDDTPFRIRISDLDRRALARSDDVEPGEGAELETLFSTAGMRDAQPHWKLGAHDQCSRDRATCAPPPMSFFMSFMFAGRLQIEAAAVEANSFADEGHSGVRKSRPR